MVSNSMRNQGIRKSIGAGQRRLTCAFTLVELLVVIAISTILLALLFGPVISSFNLTRRARAVAQAQDAARFGLERMSREIGRATYIYDNSLAPVALPLKAPGSTRNDGLPLPTAIDDYSRWPRLGYARLDIIQAATRTITGAVIDPTTGEPVKGAELQPGVRGNRAVRYFLGLRNPVKANGDPEYYQNQYEFPGRLSNSDDNFNPVVLYRAEYDPKDPNLFDLDAPDYNSNAANGGGFNDPVFFYSTKNSDTNQEDASGKHANGLSYGTNWRAISSVVLTSQNLDLIRWNRTGAATNRGQINAADPFSSTVAFAPVSVPGDPASPGYSTNDAVETAGAVPTLYLTRYGSWTYPYRITVLRGSSNVGGNRPENVEPFGTLTMTVNRDDNNRIFIESVVAPAKVKLGPTGAEVTNSLATPNRSVYSVFSPATRKLFVKTPNLTFAVDTDRGRIETAFPPLMGSTGRAPYYIDATNSAIGALTAVPAFPAFPQNGELIPTKLFVTTRDPAAGRGGVPLNQGLLRVNLFAPAYAPVDNLPAGTYPVVSPLAVFGVTSGTGRLRGVRIIPGTERVMAPTNAGGVPTFWTRLPTGGTDQVEQLPAGLEGNTYTKIPDRQPIYKFLYDIDMSDQTADLLQMLQFDTATNVAGTGAAGLPVNPINPATDSTPPDMLEATYLWQNNYSRNNVAGPYWGAAMDATGNSIGFGSAARPEADIFRVDYATRSQYTITLGARVYDPSSSQTQTIQVTDKVLVNNAIR